MKLLTPNEVLQALQDGRNLEFKHLGFKEWAKLNPLDNPLSLESIFKGGVSFRLAPAMDTIGNVSFPKPETTKPTSGTRYWIADPVSENFTRAYRMEWVDDSYDNRVLSRGLLHLSEENAIAHAKALIKLSGGNVDE